MTKTIILTTSWLGTPERIKRHKDWLEWHLPLLDKMVVSEIWWLDNASNFHTLMDLEINFGKKYTVNVINGINIENQKYIYSGLGEKVFIYRYKEHLERKSVWNYPYSWRALYDIPKIAKFTGADKIISIDTDFYVLSQRAIDWLRDTNEGWQAAWCPTHSFPEAAFSILSDIGILENFISENPDWTKFNGVKTMEFWLPFTEINLGLKGDRYSELGIEIPKDADFCGQQEFKPNLLWK